MANIIAGRFALQDEAQHAIAELVNAGFRREHISTFYLNPAGQHATYEIGGDHDKSAGAKSSGRGVAAGVATGAVIGIAATPALGPLGPVAGGLLGGHVGGLVGGLSSMKESGDPGEDGEDVENVQPVRHAGMYVAVASDDDDGLDRAADALLQLGATDLECAQGDIANGEWDSFDPSHPPVPYSRGGQRPLPSGPTQRA